MLQTLLSRAAVALALAGVLAAAPADAQSSGKGQKKARPVPTQELRERERPELRRREYDDRWDDWWNDGRVLGREQGPPFCQSGAGHPVHGRDWCAERGFRLGADARAGERRDLPGRAGNGSYDSAHDEFHRAHDRQCRLRAAERPLDPAWQIRVRTECRQTHEAWHRRAGRAHD